MKCGRTAILVVMLLLLIGSMVLPLNTPSERYYSRHLMGAITTHGVLACTVYAVGPHAIVTAAHCVTPSSEVYIEKTHVRVAEVIDDGQDHALMLLDGIAFKNWVLLRPLNPRPAIHITTWGNPVALGLVDQYREGYCMGSGKEDDGHTSYIFMLPSTPGDSGALIFDWRGRVVGMISGGQGVFVKSHEFMFSIQQLRHAEGYAPKK